MAESFDLKEIEKRMRGALGVLKTEFGGLRTGRASASLLDPITVSVYGQRMPINQVATINVPEPRMLTVTVWDKSQVAAVDKAIRESDLGLNPVMDGAAFAIARDTRIPILVFCGEGQGAIAAALSGAAPSTLVSAS